MTFLLQISVIQRLTCTLISSDCEDYRLPFLPTHGQALSLSRQMKYVKDVTMAGAHHQDKSIADYLRTQQLSEQARPEICLAPLPACGYLPASWGHRVPCQPLPHRSPPRTPTTGSAGSSQPTSEPNHRNLLMLHPFHFLSWAPPHLCPRRRGQGPPASHPVL